MYHTIGVDKDGKLGLWSLERTRPTLEELESAAKAGGYTQLLVTESSGGQIARFVVLTTLLKEVDLA